MEVRTYQIPQGYPSFEILTDIDLQQAVIQVWQNDQLVTPSLHRSIGGVVFYDLFSGGRVVIIGELKQSEKVDEPEVEVAERSGSEGSGKASRRGSKPRPQRPASDL